MTCKVTITDLYLTYFCSASDLSHLSVRSGKVNKYYICESDKDNSISASMMKLERPGRN